MQLMDMKEKEKVELVRDITSRLCFGLVVEFSGIRCRLNRVYIQPHYNHTNQAKGVTALCELFDDDEYVSVEHVRPILKRLDNIEERDLIDYRQYSGDMTATSDDILKMDNQEKRDWLCSRFFDTRGLIDKGLAIDESTLGSREYGYDHEL